MLVALCKLTRNNCEHFNQHPAIHLALFEKFKLSLEKFPEVRYADRKIDKNFAELNMIAVYVGIGVFANTKTIEDFCLQISMIDGNKLRKKGVR